MRRKSLLAPPATAGCQGTQLPVWCKLSHNRNMLRYAHLYEQYNLLQQGLKRSSAAAAHSVLALTR